MACSDDEKNMEANLRHARRIAKMKAQQAEEAKPDEDDASCSSSSGWGPTPYGPETDKDIKWECEEVDFSDLPEDVQKSLETVVDLKVVTFCFVCFVSLPFQH